jgi:hypothetical protein
MVTISRASPHEDAMPIDRHARDVVALLSAFRRHGIQLAAKAPALRGVLQREWRVVDDDGEAVMALQLEIVCAFYADALRRSLIVFTSTRTPPSAVRLSTGPIATPVAERFLARVLPHSRAPELALFEPAQRWARADALAAGSRADLAELRLAVENVAAAAEARIRPSSEGGRRVHLGRIVLPVLIVTGPLVESWRTSQGDIRMVEQDEVQVITLSPGSPEPRVVLLVRERAMEAIALRARKAFDVLRKHRRALNETNPIRHDR